MEMQSKDGTVFYVNSIIEECASWRNWPQLVNEGIIWRECKVKIELIKLNREEAKKKAGLLEKICNVKEWLEENFGDPEELDPVIYAIYEREVKNKLEPLLQSYREIGNNAEKIYLEIDGAEGIQYKLGQIVSPEDIERRLAQNY